MQPIFCSYPCLCACVYLCFPYRPCHVPNCSNLSTNADSVARSHVYLTTNIQHLITNVSSSWGCDATPAEIACWNLAFQVLSFTVPLRSVSFPVYCSYCYLSPSSSPWANRCGGGIHRLLLLAGWIAGFATALCSVVVAHAIQSMSTIHLLE